MIFSGGFAAEPGLAAVIGDGAELVTEAAVTLCDSVEPVHFLALFAKTGGSILRTRLLSRHGIDPGLFCRSLYEEVLGESGQSGVPTSVGRAAMSAESLRMLDTFEQRAGAPGILHPGEALFLLTVLDYVPAATPLLHAVSGSSEELEHFTDRLHQLSRAPALPGVDPIDPATGLLNVEAFDPSGRRVLVALREETAALGYRKATALHLLYTLVGMENGVPAGALQIQGTDPRREVHGALALRLRRSEARRVECPELGRDSLFDSVQQILKEAVNEAGCEGAEAGELHIARASIARDRGGIAEWLIDRGIDLARIRDYLTHIDPVEASEPDDRLTPVAEIGQRLRERVLGQDHAIAQALPWIKRLRYGFPKERGPAAVFLFLGPSGTGKTELAKELARTVYGSDEHLLMLEMGQFATELSVNLFIGAPPGYVGYGQGKLTNGLRDKPRCVVLFDEIEKAHQDVWSALLRFLDEGLIDDPAGPVRDGRGCIVVLTSNLGTTEAFTRLIPEPSAAQDATGGMDAALDEVIRKEVVAYVKRPEFYNRVDCKVIFRPLDELVYRRLVERQAATETAKFAERGTRVEVTPGVLDWLTAQAMAYRKEGARCVPRLATHYIVSPVIDLLTADDGPVPEKVIVGMRAGGTFADRRA